MGKPGVSRFDVSGQLDSEEMITEYLNAALEENDPELVMSAIADIARIKKKPRQSLGMTGLVPETGVEPVRP